jgi:hypothetical protein
MSSKPLANRISRPKAAARLAHWKACKWWSLGSGPYRCATVLEVTRHPSSGASYGETPANLMTILLVTGCASTQFLLVFSSSIFSLASTGLRPLFVVRSDFLLQTPPRLTSIICPPNKDYRVLRRVFSDRHDDLAGSQAPFSVPFFSNTAASELPSDFYATSFLEGLGLDEGSSVSRELATSAARAGGGPLDPPSRAHDLPYSPT